MSTAEIHCHHIIHKRNGGTDKYDNLILITPDVHILLHAKTHETIEKYKAMPERIYCYQMVARPAF